MIRYFNENRAPLSNKATTGVYQLECEDGTNEWNDSGSSNIIWDGEVPRFKNDAEQADDIRQDVRDAINKKTEELVVANVFTYGGVDFRCTRGDQIDYKMELDRVKVYPHNVKGMGDTYLTVNSKEEHEAFFDAGFADVYGVLVVGRVIKADLATMTYQQLLDFKDTR